MNVSNKREQNEFTHSAESEKGATKLNNENFELENMRQQMETLKKKLDQQEIVNDHLIRHSMKKTAGNISRRYYFIMAVCLLMIPYSYWAFVMLNGFSIPFWIFTVAVWPAPRSSMPTGSSSVSPSPSSFLAGLCTSRISFILAHFSTDSSGQDA